MEPDQTTASLEMGHDHPNRWELRVLAVGAVVAVAIPLVWDLTGRGYFWPLWAWAGLAAATVGERVTRWAVSPRRRSPLLIVATEAVMAVAVCVAVWLLCGGGYPWPAWPALGSAIAVAVVAIVLPPRSARERRLDQRVDALSDSRRSAVEVHAAELRRVERDLHDGAQARLVSLGMSLGMAEELLAEDPAEALRLLGDARTSAGDALADLRHLVRGIHPPVLAERGLEGALQALAASLPLPVTVTVDLAGRLADPVESAVYFAVAECLTNTVKHSGAATGWVSITHDQTVLDAVVGDDGRGGADPDSGAGLSGIRQRLSAFEGTVGIVSPPGGPTVIKVTVPCELSSPKISPS